LTDDALKAVAEAARSNAYAPYSNFRVGAAILSSAGEIYGGCNVENASYPAGICAERTALAAAVTSGAAGFEALVIVSDAEEPAAPCGICRQVLAEFSPALRIVSYGMNGVSARWSLRELLPHQFRLNKSNGLTE
jgi:cytidine deaminase